jgi:hypothetical protein
LNLTPFPPPKQKAAGQRIAAQAACYRYGWKKADAHLLPLQDQFKKMTLL